MSSKKLTIPKGYSFRVKGAASTQTVEVTSSQSVGLTPVEFDKVKVQVLVKEGDSVKRGTPIYRDKNMPEAVFVSPVAGKVTGFDIGKRRIYHSIDIQASGKDAESFPKWNLDQISGKSDTEVREVIQKGGLWGLLQSTPLDRIANPSDTPQDIYVSAYSLQPNSWDCEVVASYYKDSLAAGLKLLSRMANVVVLTNGKAPTSEAAASDAGVELIQVKGRYGTDSAYAVSYADRPLKKGACFWHLDIQGAGLLGRLVLEGSYPAERIVAINGTGLKSEHRTHAVLIQGASVQEVLGPMLASDNIRIISGGLLNGKKVRQDKYLAWHQSAIQVIPEEKPRQMFSFFRPGFDKPTYSRTYLGGVLGRSKEYEYYADQNGEERACIQCEYCTEVCPVGLMPDLLFKTALAEEYDNMERQGIYDCSDCGLCSYVCPSKINVNGIIREGARKLVDEE
jgi:Na+-transporting NADH:ubiquinone oxidoreductase subunit A